MPKTAMYVLQGVDPAVIAAAPFDVKVVEVYTDDGQMFTPAEVKQMGGGPGQALLLGYFSLGEAEAYRDYFASIPSEALGPEDPNWAGDFEVAYWTPEWKGVAEASIDRMVKAGYDGIYFDVVDAFQLPWSQAHAPGGDAAGAMRTLVQELSAYAKAQAPTFKVWVNGAEELLTDKAYVDSIDGLFKENLFYNDDGSAKQPTAETQASLDQLKIAQDAGKDVVAIEYVTGAQKVADVHAQAEAAGMGSYVAKLDLIGIDTEGVLPGQIMHDDGLLHDDGRGGAAAPPEPTPLTPPPATTPVDQDGTATAVGPDQHAARHQGYGDHAVSHGHHPVASEAGADSFVFAEGGQGAGDPAADLRVEAMATMADAPEPSLLEAGDHATGTDSGEHLDVAPHHTPHSGLSHHDIPLF